MISKKQSGFTLIELMIVIAIIGILASVALPAYSTYTKKAKFSEVVLAASNGKGLADLCYQTRGDITQCNGDNTGLGLDINASTLTIGDHVLSFATTAVAGGIILTTTGEATVDSATYVLTGTDPVLNPLGSLKWVVSGSCMTKGLC
ncbi:MAG: prepilin-type N-terminal cleavage/methylation domain-containing protein [Gammaproteobacteria bacterium]|nr:prepilin-type N-terminal cleavage/methylation domain-containing protein [Gammaproteobacteria bacterium]